ncbi:hypothetical protein Slin15195_G063670 [Septoria linicola]|uniref:Uncharacterized protein n=1 Tax=Septoria linicola TaxID=215465 RepID=A0A9Q9ATS9_9PEZI|nr:hypothetical protein Slin15195_G063670 [Septoria linicola]
MATLAEEAAAGQPMRCAMATSSDSGPSRFVPHYEARGGAFAPATTINPVRPVQLQQIQKIKGGFPHDEANVERAVAQMTAPHLSIDDGISTRPTTPAPLVQTAAQRVLNLPDLLEPILISVATEDTRAWWYYLKDSKTVLLAQRVNSTWRRVIQESKPIKQALWLKHDPDFYGGLSKRTHWNPFIWPQPPAFDRITFDEEWMREGSRTTQS